MELDTRIGTFVPTGAVHLLGPEIYSSLICDNNSFLENIATVPVGDFQHETLDIPFSYDSNTDIDTTTINELILEQSWCLNVEQTTTPNKVLIVTTKGQLATAREWIDNSLPALYNQHVNNKINVTTLKHLTPRRLDKPTVTLASMTYAEKLKLHTTYTTTAQTMSQFNHPPCPKNTKHPDLTYEPAATQSTMPAAPASNRTQTAHSTPLLTAVPPTAPFDYQAELKRITYKIENNLKAKFEAAIANIQQAVANLDRKLDEKLQQHVTDMKTMQADKTTHDNHT